MEEVIGALSRALRAPGTTPTELRTFQAAKLPLAQQVEAFASARGLIGVHGAGLSSVMFLPSDASLLELVPASHPIPNGLEDDALSSQCGYTMFWYLAEVANVRYRALLLLDYGWDDAVLVPLEPLVQAAMAMVREAPPETHIGRDRQQHADKRTMVDPSGTAFLAAAQTPTAAAAALLMVLLGAGAALLARRATATLRARATTTLRSQPGAGRRPWHRPKAKPKAS